MDMESSGVFGAVEGEPAGRFYLDHDSEDEPLEKRRKTENANSKDLQLIKADANDMKQSIKHIEQRITKIEESLQKMFNMLKQALHQTAPIEEESEKADELCEEEEAHHMIAEKSASVTHDQPTQDGKSVRDYFSQLFVDGAPHPSDDGRYCTLCEERYAKSTSTFVLYRHLKKIHNVDVQKSAKYRNIEVADSSSEMNEPEETFNEDSEGENMDENQESVIRGDRSTIFVITAVKNPISEESKLNATEVVRQPGKKNNFWSYFDRLTSDDDQTPGGRCCTICKKVYSSNTSTTVLRRHLELSHDIVDLKKKSRIKTKRLKKTFH